MGTCAGRGSQHFGSRSVASLRMDTTAMAAAMHPSLHEIVVAAHLKSELLIISQLPNESLRYVDKFDSPLEFISDNGIYTTSQ